MSEEALRRFIGGKYQRQQQREITASAALVGEGGGGGVGGKEDGIKQEHTQINGIVRKEVPVKSAYQQCWDMLVEHAKNDNEEEGEGGGGGGGGRDGLQRMDFEGPMVNAESRFWRRPVRMGRKVGG